MNRHEIEAIYDQGVAAVIDLVEQLFRVIDAQQSQIQEQGLLITSLTARVEELEQRLQQNSGNSHQPPSSDQFHKRTRSLRESSGRHSGAQAGHKGSNLKQVATPDQVIVHLPVACLVCGTSLQEIEPHIAKEKRQVFDIPPLRLEVTEHQLGVKQCPCCQTETRAQFPAAVANLASYGERIKALGLFLHKEHLVPSRRTCEILETLFEQPFSEGSLFNLVSECATELLEIEQVIKEAVTQAAQANFDETGIYVENHREWLHVAATDRLTFYSAHPKRGQKALEAIGILPKFSGCATHDCWSSYFIYGDCQHSVCNAHNLRELIFVHEVMNREWALEMKELWKNIKQEVAKAQEQGHEKLEALLRESRQEQYESIVQKGFEREALEPALPRSGKRGKPKQSKAKNLLDRLEKYKEETLKFMKDFRVPFDNNLAERDLRMMKVQQKISGCFRTRKGAEDFCRIKSYLSTMKKQGHNLIEALRSVFNGNPIAPTLSG